MTGTPSIYFIDAWEETDVLMVSLAGSNTAMSIPAYAEMRTRLNDTHHFDLQKRLHASISLSAEQLYQDLMENAPEILQRFPQHVIASYLGVAKETLSRIRSNAVGR